MGVLTRGTENLWDTDREWAFFQPSAGKVSLEHGKAAGVGITNLVKVAG